MMWKPVRIQKKSNWTDRRSNKKKTRDILSKGILKQNFDEFIDEFDSYWFEESYDRYLSLVEPSDEIKKSIFGTLLFKNAA